ncbi:hypothetical protein NUW54_g3815 [Trametes sanguinea]|uniref:Uncharacterized protein n=1 Tax=Trametes sanguinea TaxID=158606 RepID=A0ACC1PZQ1_9APHY|nr:hypothetical protein NUW54_g3815 [Trametes sanguinea]
MQELFSRTVGPVKDVFMVYNSRGQSKGMAVVTFARSGDASVARASTIGRSWTGVCAHRPLPANLEHRSLLSPGRPIMIELVVDDDEALPAQASRPSAPSLLQRISLPPAAQAARPTTNVGKTRAPASMRDERHAYTRLR